VLGGKTLDKVRKRKMMRRRKIVMMKLGFFFPWQACLIYKYILMGLRRDKVQNTSMGFYIMPRADDKEETAYQIQRYV
jgi:hypothetical protein